MARIIEDTIEQNILKRLKQTAPVSNFGGEV